MKKVLYVSRTGMLEPLGQSQVLAYLRGLSRHYQVTLVSFEKAEELADGAAIERIQAICDAHGIRWLPQRYRHKPRVLASTWNALVLFFVILREVVLGGARLIHARSYIPAAAAMAISRITGVPYIFDMRSLWPEELITSGRLRRGSWLHKVIVAAERACLRHASAVVSLTHAALDYLRAEYPRELESQRIVVIPTCTDLDRFRSDDARRSTRGRVYGCHGSILTGWFRVDMLSAWLQAIARREPEASFQVVTREDPAKVRAAIGGDAAFQASLEIYGMPPHRVHEALQKQDVAVMFYAGGNASELGRSPTRMGEVLGCGQPVVANAGVGDVARIIETHRIGVLLDGTSDAAVDRAIDALEVLLREPDLEQRCREAAESVFSLERGTRDYAALYATLLSDTPHSHPSS